MPDVETTQKQERNGGVLKRGQSFIGLGPLEVQILNVVWKFDRSHSAATAAVTVRDVYEALLKRRHIAYTTVMAVMGNLTRKKYLQQTRGPGQAYTYRALADRCDVAEQCLQVIVDELCGGDLNECASFLDDMKAVASRA